MKKYQVFIFVCLLALLLSACSSATDKATQSAPSATSSESATTSPKPSDPASPTATASSSASPTSSAEASKAPTESATPTESDAPPAGPVATVKLPEGTPKFEYPDAVRGIYVTGWSAGGEKMKKLIPLLDKTDLNAMVIDVKDDDGHITFKTTGKLAEFGMPYIKDPKALMKTLAEHKIYPIARIVTFKDTVMAKKRPDLSYVQGNAIWRNGRGEGFINPFLKETWDHDLDAAKLAAELGFKEIQFDYVRFPEGFERKDKILKYSMGEYKNKKPVKFIQQEDDYAANMKKYKDGLAPLEVAVTGATNKYNADKSATNKTALTTAKKALESYKKKAPKAPDFSEKARLTQLRVDAVSDFVAYAKKQLEPYGVQVSVDIFGYSATLPEAPGIGQNFTRISESVDVISSMIYPSHWSNGYFGIARPDKEPYKLTFEYAKREKEKFAEMKTPPVSRPWIQDFTAPWLGAGNYIKYGKAEVDAQIKALKDSGIHEYLLWNAGNTYTPNVVYTP